MTGGLGRIHLARGEPWGLGVVERFGECNDVRRIEADDPRAEGFCFGFLIGGGFVLREGWQTGERRHNRKGQSDDNERGWISHVKFL